MYFRLVEPIATIGGDVIPRAVRAPESSARSASLTSSPPTIATIAASWPQTVEGSSRPASRARKVLQPSGPISRSRSSTCSGPAIAGHRRTTSTRRSFAGCSPLRNTSEMQARVA